MTAAPTLAKAVDRLFEPYSRAGSPGAVVAVTQDGREIAGGAYGLASINHGVPLDRQSVLRIGSQTKQFTVLLLLMLEAEGRLSLDDAVQDHLPWVPRFEHPTTLRHLASNTSGIRDHFEALTFSGRSIFAPSTHQDAREVIARQDRLNFVPGERMIYSNAGFFLLSELVERLADAPFDDVLKERITGPLGMSDTRLVARDSAVAPRLATHHSLAPDGSWQRLPWGLVLGGEGGMVSTLDDMLLWQANLRKPQVGTPAMYERMSTPTRYANGAESPYGLGLVSYRYRGMRSIGHGGSVAGGRSESVLFPEADLGIVILGNTDAIAPFSLARRIADHRFGHPPRTSRNSGEVAGLAESAGLYRDANGGDVFEVVVRDGKPVLVTSSGATSLDQVEPNRFRPETGIVDLTLSPMGDDRMEAISCGARTEFRRLKRDLPGTEPCVGRYAHSKLGLEAEVVQIDNDRFRLLIRSSLGALRAQLRLVDHDLCLLSSADEAPRTDRPWIAAITFRAGEMTLSSDRTKLLTFARLR